MILRESLEHGGSEITGICGELLHKNANGVFVSGSVGELDYKKAWSLLKKHYLSLTISLFSFMESIMVECY